MIHLNLWPPRPGRAANRRGGERVTLPRGVFRYTDYVCAECGPYLVIHYTTGYNAKCCFCGLAPTVLESKWARAGDKVSLAGELVTPKKSA